MGYIDVSAQALTFLMSVGLGAVLCLLYDVVRVLHKTCVKGFVEVLVCDLLFWGLAAFITFSFLIIRCEGTVRGFVLIGQIIGAVVTRYTLSRFFMALLMRIMSVFSFIFRGIRLAFRKITAPIEKIFKKMLFVAKKGLQHKAVLLYNQLKVRMSRVKHDSKTEFKEM